MYDIQVAKSSLYSLPQKTPYQRRDSERDFKPYSHMMRLTGKKIPEVLVIVARSSDVCILPIGFMSITPDSLLITVTFFVAFG